MFDNGMDGCIGVVGVVFCLFGIGFVNIIFNMGLLCFIILFGFSNDVGLVNDGFGLNGSNFFDDEYSNECMFMEEEVEEVVMFVGIIMIIMGMVCIGLFLLIVGGIVGLVFLIFK